jgi:intein/homing endonuclease
MMTIVLTHSGEYKKVLNIIEKDVSTYIKIIVNGNTIICSEDHKFIVFRDGQIIESESKRY